MIKHEELLILKFLSSAVNDGKKITITPDRRSAVSKALELCEQQQKNNTRNLEVLNKLKSIQNEGLAVEEATQGELISFIAEMKFSIDEVVSLLENKEQN